MIINKVDNDIDTEKLKRIVSDFLKHYKQKNKHISIALVDDQEIKRLNKKFLNREGVTDVIAFPGNKKDLGEVIIDYDQIMRQAKEDGNSSCYELQFVMVHGLLHLLGWEDYTSEDKERMLREGERFLRLALTFNN